MPGVVGGGQDGRPSEKASRTPAQQKIDSHLLQEIYRRRGQAAEKQIPIGPTGVRIDKSGRALVDVRAPVTPRLEQKIRRIKGIVVSTSVEYLSIVAWVPLMKLESLAEDGTVVAIVPAAEAMTNKVIK